jgi:glycosyltransferase involved in cell wall biosynthesis
LTAGRSIRVLVLSPIPEEGAGCRFRIAQFIPYLEAKDFEVTLSPLYTTEFFRRVYKPGQRLRKSVGFAGLSIKRLTSLQGLSRFDVIFIYREVFPIGPAVIERLLSTFGGVPFVFDFDDAIFLPSVSGVSEANRFIAAWKFPGKFATIIRLSDQVIAGNDYLAAYARRFNGTVTMIPTCVDTTKFVPRSDQRESGKLVVGWIGSPTTAPYIRGLANVLRTVASKHRFVMRISGAGNIIELPGVDVENPAWALDREVSLFNTCDVGVYPLPDDEWSKGKCGFKAIEFMACGVPVVAAAVGVNREIIQDGVNGFLASTEAEWVEKLQRLLEDPALRARFAEAGRRTIEERYSLRAHAPRLAAVLRASAERGHEAQKRAG